ncbi:hypothetical protein [Candidatus Cryosericum terrychapinii]|uniref:hypothetical protein n=1 Tax=Candidatus Cryosericum terrychapinii TaxID=2290919 RepID=UPI000F88A2C5|nr:hypothetical protein [Candidatus Cryosericum terrychapinii]
MRVVAAFLDDQGLSPFGDFVQVLLTEENLMVQARQVQLRTRGQEASLCLFGHVHPCQHPDARCLCRVVHLGDVAPGPDLVEELLAGKEPAHL